MSEPQDDPDLVLLQEWLAGNKDAGNRLSRRSQKWLRRLFSTKVPIFEIDELVQQTWLALVTACREGTASGVPKSTLDEEPGPVFKFPFARIQKTFRAYLLGIAHYKLLTYYRKLQTGKRFDPEVDSLETLSPSLSQQLSFQRRLQLIELVLRRLPLNLQLLFEARFMDELSGNELAQIFDIPKATVRSRLHRARQLIDEMMNASRTAPQEQ